MVKIYEIFQLGCSLLRKSFGKPSTDKKQMSPYTFEFLKIQDIFCFRSTTCPKTIGKCLIFM